MITDSRRVTYAGSLFAWASLCASCTNESPLSTPDCSTEINPSSATTRFPRDDFFPGATRLVSELEPNDDFPQAQAINLFDVVVQVSGHTMGRSDVDVFSLRNFKRGESVHVELTGEAAYCKAALFDEAYNFLAVRSRVLYEGDGGTLQLSFVFRDSISMAYLAIAECLAGPNYESAYTVRVSVDKAIEIPAPTPQDVLIVLSRELETSDVDVGDPTGIGFSTRHIDEVFAERSGGIQRLFLRELKMRFAMVSVHIVTPADWNGLSESLSVLHFKEYGNATLGWAQDIDESNDDLTQHAYVYYYGFRQAAQFDASDEQLAHALANVAAHEIGHLLGLRHTTGGEDLMTTGEGLGNIYRPRGFTRARLHEEVFPIGFQDATRLLAATVGRKTH